jgi:hypothetical protein
MNLPILDLLLIIAAVVLAVGLGVLFASRNKRSKKLKEKFGSEYNLAMETGNRKTTEKDLDEREKRVKNLGIRELNEIERNRYKAEWSEIQGNFVDDPTKSVADANQLITEVMILRGFPVADFEQRAADLSVIYPDFVANYRNANALALQSKTDGTSTEELRQAIGAYRSMANELLGTSDIN